MTTTVVKTIGTAGGRDYSTVAAWEAAAPADLTAVDQIWQGECYNDSEFLVTAKIQVSGTTVDATRYKRLTAAAGQSFADNANKTTNALRYNQSNGVGIRTTTGYIGGLLVWSENYGTVDRLQFKNTGADGLNWGISFTGGGALKIKQCIVEMGTSGGLRALSAANCEFDNVLVIQRRSSSYGIYTKYQSTTTHIHNCTVVFPNGDTNTSSTGIFSSGSPTTLVKNCAVFGFATNFSGTWDSGSGYNATSDASAPGSSNQVSKTYSAQFQNYSNSAMDFRVASSGSDLHNGTPDSTYTGGVDIVGQTRDATTPYIGAWEIVSAGAAFMPQPGISIRQAINRASTY